MRRVIVTAFFSALSVCISAQNSTFVTAVTDVTTATLRTSYVPTTTSALDSTSSTSLAVQSTISTSAATSVVPSTSSNPEAGTLLTITTVVVTSLAPIPTDGALSPSFA